MYQTSREEHCRKLDSVWKNVESALQALSRAKGEQFTGGKTQLRASYECYEHATARYSAFLEKAKTSEARHELQLQQAIDEDREAIVSEKLREATPQERDKAHETASQFSLSVHSRASSQSRRSGSSTIFLAAVQARAQAEAVKARAQFGRKETAMRLEKARIEAELESIICHLLCRLTGRVKAPVVDGRRNARRRADSLYQPQQQHRFFTGTY
ncbi:hypothetical protein HPB51_029624 [Rhipicephalus microplus]|uniref:Uncharacterized protein n=1 Tax=Rhipicephalus microplus TaxID=6941 RepID=A0A9J6CUA3_RHIMP|nr:hypothetical protein HPB51_029624 [Rhipicephalus microplus]